MYSLLVTISIIQGLAILLIVVFCTWGAYHFLYDLCERKLNLRSPREKIKDIPLKVALLVSKIISISLPIILLCAWAFAYLSYWRLNRLHLSSNEVVSISLYGMAEIVCTLILIIACITQYISAKSISRGKIKYRNLLMLSWSIILLTVFNLNSYFGNVIVHFFLDGAALFCFWVLALRQYEATAINKDCKNFSYAVKLALLIIFIGIIVAPNMDMGHKVVDVSQFEKIYSKAEKISVKNEPLYLMFHYDDKDLDKLTQQLAKILTLKYKLPCERGIDREYLDTLSENTKVLSLTVKETPKTLVKPIPVLLENYPIDKVLEINLLTTAKDGNHSVIPLSKIHFAGKKHQLKRLLPKIAAEEIATIFTK